MGWFINDYQKIKQSNNDESVKLRRDNRKMIERMMEYISSNNISLFEVEILKKDLIGIALEAETEQVSMNEKLGVSEKEFCDSLIKDAMKKNFFEFILLLVKDIALGVALYNTFFFVVLGCPERYGILLGAILYSAIVVATSSIIERKASGKFAYSKNGKRKIGMIQGMFTLGWLIIIIMPFGYNMFEHQLFVGNGWVVTLTVLAITAVIYFMNNYYWNCQAKKYNWK